VDATRVEPATCRLQGGCSAEIELAEIRPDTGPGAALIAVDLQSRNASSKSLFVMASRAGFEPASPD
jgi:hypothetical protein